MVGSAQFCATPPHMDCGQSQGKCAEADSESRCSGTMYVLV